MSGHYRMHRGWMDNPALGGKREPYCRRAAWAWLIENANWRDGKTDAGGKTIDLKRGQLCHSYRYMADAWGWTVATVQRFLDRLVTDTMIERTADTGRLVITICNYSKYQIGPRIGDTETDTPSDTSPVRERYAADTNKKEGKEGKEEGSVEADASTGAESASAANLPVINPEKVVWGQCLDWLAAASDQPREKLRSVVGLWVKRHGKADVLETIQATSRAPPVGDPVAWITATLSRKAERNAPGSRRTEPSRQRRDGFAVLAEQIAQGGDGRPDDPELFGGRGGDDPPPWDLDLSASYSRVAG